MSYPPLQNSSLFNSSYFVDSSLALTTEIGDLRYLKQGSSGTLSGLSVADNLDCGSLSIGGVSADFSAIAAISGITLGVPQASKALTLNSAGNVNGRLRLYNGSTYSGIMDTASIVVQYPGASTGQKCSIDFFVSNISIDSLNVAGASIIHERTGGNSQGALIFSTKRLTSNTSPCVEALRITQTGSCVIANTSSGYQLNLGGSGTGINTGSLKFNDVTFDQSMYLNITRGSVEANKALVPNADLDLNSFRNLSMTGELTCPLIKAPVAFTNTSLVSLQQMTYGNNFDLLIRRPTDTEGHVSGIGFTTSTLATTILPPAASIMFECGDSLSGDLIFSTTQQERMRIAANGNITARDLALTNILNAAHVSCTGNVSATRFNIQGGGPFQIFTRSEAGFTSGLNITRSNSDAVTNTNYNVVLSSQAGTIPHVVVNAAKAQTHIMPQDLTELQTTYAQKTIIGSSALVRGSLSIGSGNTSTAYALAVTDSTMSVGTNEYILLGQSTNSMGCGYLSYYYAGSGNSSNNLTIGVFGGSYPMTLTGSGRVGLGTSTPTCGLDVAAGENSVLFTSNISVNTYSYQISSNSFTNYGGGPTSAAICARFRGSVWIQDRLWATSDRRLKKDIKSIDFDLDHFKKLNPVSYTWKNSDKPQLGLIAQEVKNVCSEAVSIVENENMKLEEDDDIEGAQYTVDYNCVTMMNVVAIKKLLYRIDRLDSLVEKLIARPVVAKWMNKSS